MKKLLVSTLLALGLISTAGAHGWHGGYRGGYYGCGSCWVAPAIVGGVIGYELARPNYYVEPAPVVIQQQPVIVQGQSCSPWTQIQNPDGTVTTTRTCTQ